MPKVQTIPLEILRPAHKEYGAKKSGRYIQIVVLNELLLRVRTNECNDKLQIIWILYRYKNPEPLSEMDWMSQVGWNVFANFVQLDQIFIPK